MALRQFAVCGTAPQTCRRIPENLNPGRPLPLGDASEVAIGVAGMLLEAVSECKQRRAATSQTYVAGAPRSLCCNCAS